MDTDAVGDTSVTNPKGVSSMKLHEDLNIAQISAWHLSHRIYAALSSGSELFCGSAEADETYRGGNPKNMGNAKRKDLEGTGWIAVSKTAVVGARDREPNQVAAKAGETTDRVTLRGFVKDWVDSQSTVYTGTSLARLCLAWTVIGSTTITSSRPTVWNPERRR